MKNHEVKENIYTPFFYNGYLLYNMYPEYKHFIDYRTLFISGMPLLDDLKIRQAEIGWEFIIDRYHVNSMLLRYAPGKRYLLQKRDQFHEKVVHSPDWRLVYFDDDNLVYVRSHYEIYNYDKDRFFLYYDPEDIWSVATADELHTQMIKSDLTRRISMDPPCAWAYVALGVISIKEGNYDKASEYFDKAASIRPDDKKISLYKSLWNQRLESSPPLAIKSSKKFKKAI